MRNREAKWFHICLILLITIGSLTLINAIGENQSETNDGARLINSLHTSSQDRPSVKENADKENSSGFIMTLTKYSPLVPYVLGFFSFCLIIIGLVNLHHTLTKGKKDKTEKPTQSKLKDVGNYIIRTIAPRGFSRYIAFSILKPSTGNFFRKFAYEQTRVVYAHRDVDALKPGTQVYDFEGIIDLTKFFSEKLGTELIGAKAISLSPQEKVENNLICIGGPIPNKITETMLEQYEIRYKFQDHIIIDKLENKKPIYGFSSNWTGSNPSEDFGIITRIGREFPIGCYI